MSERDSLLLLSKLRVPPWRVDWVARPRLLDRADQMAGARLLLCSAPAGFGKTTALIAWAARRCAAGAAVAWYTLDDADNDPDRFAAYLIGAFAQADPQLPLADLQRRVGADRDQLLVGLLNLLAATDPPTALVFDDYHVIQSPAVHQALATLIERLPDGVQLAIATRADPPLPLARLRARGQLVELRAADLQFAPDEVAAFFQRGVRQQLSADAITRLAEWSEGWAAGLQLLAIALTSLPSGTAVIDQIQTHLAGSQRHAFTFLADEVFALQPAAIQDFLLTTCVVDDLTPELCAVLWKDAGSTNSILHPVSFILEQLEQANLFIVRLDAVRPWYRYHHLFRQFLRRRLDIERPGYRAQLHQCAARWYASTGNLAQAADHAFAGEDTAYAAELIVRVAWEQFSSHGEIVRILNWAGHFSTAQLIASPVLSLSFGQAAMMAEQASTAAHYFALAEQGMARLDTNPANLAIRLKFLFYQALALAMDGKIGRSRELLATMERLLPPTQDAPGIAAGHALVCGICAVLCGDRSVAYAELGRMEQLASQAQHLHFMIESIQMLALSDLMAGQLERTERRCNDLLARFGAALPPVPALGLVLGWLGGVAYQRGQLEQAERLLRQGAQHGRRSSGQVAIQIWYWLVRVLAARDDRAELRAVLVEAEGQTAAQPGAVMTSVIFAAQAEGWLALGEIEQAWHWAQRCAQVPGEHLRGQEMLCVARALLVMGRAAEALDHLEPWIAIIGQAGWNGLLIESLALQAWALHDLGRLEEARAALRHARALATPAGYVQPFSGAGPVILRLWQSIDQQAEIGAASLSSAVVAPVQATPPHSPASLPLLEALTEREREVLALLARGATNQDIADLLVVSVGTVKTHINHILDKLAARNRTEAVARARALGLL